MPKDILGFAPEHALIGGLVIVLIFAAMAAVIYFTSPKVVASHKSPPQPTTEEETRGISPDDWIHGWAIASTDNMIT